MRGLFKILSLANWITPAANIADNIRHIGDNELTFFLPYERNLSAGYNPKKIVKILNQYGISTRGEQYTWPQDHYMVKVPFNQAAQVSEIFKDYGIEWKLTG